jgi:hypothetical protein
MSVTLYPLNAQVKTRPTRKPVRRTLRVEGDAFNGGFVRITVNGTSTLYQTGMIPLDPAFGCFGLFFRKLDLDRTPIGDGYHVSCSSSNPEDAVIQCDCPGHQAWNHCRHADAARVLLSRLK